MLFRTVVVALLVIGTRVKLVRTNEEIQWESVICNDCYEECL
jgi:hypothetical protein